MRAYITPTLSEFIEWGQFAQPTPAAAYATKFHIACLLAALCFHFRLPGNRIVLSKIADISSLSYVILVPTPTDPIVPSRQGPRPRYHTSDTIQYQL